MRGNFLGKMISMMSFGESHGPAMGVVLDGVPSGLHFSAEDLQQELERRAPGRNAGTTSRKEDDQAEILSGIFEGQTLGTPIAVLIRNKDQKSQDYDQISSANSASSEFRVGHADHTTLLKYGIRDHRGGGRSSGRETVARVIAGHFASLIIPQVKVKAFATSIGPFQLPLNYQEKYSFDLKQDCGPYGFPYQAEWQNIENYLVQCKKEGNSVGGRVCLIVENSPVGLGEPVFDKLKADLAKALLSIGACTSFSFGLGEDFAVMNGQEVSQEKSYFGGMEGGITNGERLLMHLVFKPTSTVGEKAKLGRHDPCIVPRVLPVVEHMTKFILADHYLRQKAYQR